MGISMNSNIVLREYYVIKKNLSGDYLLSGKHTIIKQSYDEHTCWNTFIDVVLNKKSDSDSYVMCSKLSNKRYIQILCER